MKTRTHAWFIEFWDNNEYNTMAIPSYVNSNLTYFLDKLQAIAYCNYRNKIDKPQNKDSVYSGRRHRVRGRRIKK